MTNCCHFSSLRSGDHPPRRMVESRIHFVRTKECSRILNISFIKIFRIPSYLSFMHNPERSGFLTTRESVYMLNSLLNLHQALEQTGETTRACRFCLQVLNFLQMEGRSAFYRKFLRISSIKELGGQ